MNIPIARELMSGESITLLEEDNLIGVAEMMELWEVRQIPVVDGARFVGLVDERDVLRLACELPDPSSIAHHLAHRRQHSRGQLDQI